MRRTSDSPFRTRNGRRFSTALKNAASGDGKINTMFIDNYDKSNTTGSKEIIKLLINEGDFHSALMQSFDWENSNEKDGFWRNIYSNLKDYNGGQNE